jgi:hypothetical protein
MGGGPERLARLLGKVPDIDLARRAKLSFATVRNERRRRGIAPFKPLRPPIEWTAEMLALLGQASDVEVAVELGVSKTTVGCKRRWLGISAFQPQGARKQSFWTPARVALLGKVGDSASRD